MKEIKFYTVQEYYNYDFDDNFCFFYGEILEYINSIEKIDSAPFIDVPQKIASILTGLFKTYDCLIINPDEERLYGEIGGVRYLVREGAREEN